MTIETFLDQHTRWGHATRLTSISVREGTIATLTCVPCKIVIVEVRGIGK